MLRQRIILEQKAIILHVPARQRYLQIEQFIQGEEMMNTRKIKMIGCFLSVMVIAMLFGACPDSDKSPPITIPAVPTGVKAEAKSSTSIQVSWNPVSGAISYDVYFAVGSSSSSMIFIGSVTNTSYIHNNLQSDTTYYYFIRAKNNAGDSGYSSSASAKTSEGSVILPVIPTGVIASVQSSTSIQITWNSVINATSYDIYYEVGSSFIMVFTDNVTSTSYIHNNLQPNTTYNYYIKAKNNAGDSDYSASASATTLSL
jgi:fibronectin type 3 domain-containing protein